MKKIMKQDIISETERQKWNNYFREYFASHPIQDGVMQKAEYKFFCGRNMKYKIDYLDKNDRIRHKYIDAKNYEDARKITIEWLDKRNKKGIETHEVLNIQKEH